MLRNRLPLKKQQTAELASLEAAAALIQLTVPEVRKLLWQWRWRHPPKAVHTVGWSLWRRRHQAVARACHYRRRRQRENLQL
ncbi:hypothetical protein [Methylobacter luteus]|uniref:hypothetical protein n=1 Tax=Methylobacter luteus TaxID=415 RepID=UPI0003FE62B6|nr:hypothetical protein [Methylobacter luteus]